jgi:hypothetical protein
MPLGEVGDRSSPFDVAMIEPAETSVFAGVEVSTDFGLPIYAIRKNRRFARHC